MKKQDFKVLKTKDLYPFPDNPFHVAEDETLSELAESIKEFGIVTPIITRPKEDGGKRVPCTRAAAPAAALRLLYHVSEPAHTHAFLRK